MVKGNKAEETYPIKSLHEFLSELDREWSRFRKGTLVSVIISSVLLVFVVFRFSRFVIEDLDNVGLIILMFLAMFLLYNIYAMLVQYRFFRRWERRARLLFSLEERLISGRLEGNISE